MQGYFTLHGCTKLTAFQLQSPPSHFTAVFKKSFHLQPLSLLSAFFCAIFSALKYPKSLHPLASPALSFLSLHHQTLTENPVSLPKTPTPTSLCQASYPFLKVVPKTYLNPRCLNEARQLPSLDHEKVHVHFLSSVL